MISTNIKNKVCTISFEPKEDGFDQLVLIVNKKDINKVRIIYTDDNLDVNENDYLN